MASYYKYAERKTEDQVDWSAISKGVTESIEAEKTSRDSRKAAIDKASNDSMIALMDKPQGEYAKENDNIANFTEQAQSTMLNNLKLLKSGNITEREYSSLVNNLDTGTKMAFNLSKKYQAAYQGHVDRMSANKDGVTLGSNLEVDQLAFVESSFGPGANSQYVVAPSGEVQIAQMVKNDDGTQSQVGPLTSLNGAGNMIVQQIDRYQTLGAVESISDQIGQKIDSLIGKENGEGTPGYIIAKADAFKALKEAEEGGSNALELAIKSTFANSDGMASFLSDTLGTTEEGAPYKLLFKGSVEYEKLEKEDGIDDNGMPKDSSFILREQGPQGNWTSKLSTSQEARVIDSMKDLVEQKLDVKETVSIDNTLLNQQKLNLAKRKNNKPTVRKGKTKDLGNFNTLNTAMSGSAADAKGAIDSLIEKANLANASSKGKPKFNNAVRSEDGSTITITSTDRTTGVTTPTIYDISDPDVGAQVLAELFFPTMESYEQGLLDFQKQQGGFTYANIANPEFDSTQPPSETNKKSIPNPNYQGASVASKTEAQVVDMNFSTNYVDSNDSNSGTIQQAFTSAEEKDLPAIITQVVNQRKNSGLSNFTIANEKEGNFFSDTFTYIQTDINGEPVKIKIGKKGKKTQIQNNLQKLLNGKEVNGFKVIRGILTKQ